MPVIVCELGNNWDEQREGVCLEVSHNIQEEFVLKEAHSSVGDLEMRASNAFNDSLEEFRDNII